MIDKLLRLFKTEETPPNDFENLVVPNKHVKLIYSNGAVVNDSLGNTVQTKDEAQVAGQYIEMSTNAVKDGVYINLHGIMTNSDSYEEALTRVIETEIHEMMHWGDPRIGEERFDDIDHQFAFDDIIYDIMRHCGQNYHDFRDPLGKNGAWKAFV